MTKSKLKGLRKDTGLTQEEFSKKLGVTYSRYIKWENGLNPVDHIADAHILNTHKEIMSEK